MFPQKRYLLSIGACVVLVFAEVAWGASLADLRFYSNRGVLGYADSSGYVAWSLKLDEVKFNNQAIPVLLWFSTDPRLETGPLGTGWRLPLLSSKLVEENQNNLRWHRPDGGILFFARSREQENSKSTLQIYDAVDASWQAVRERNTRKFVLTHKASGSELIYENGLLLRFRFDANGKEGNYAISYNSRLSPTQVRRVRDGAALLSLTYGSDQRIKAVSTGEKEFVFSSGDAKLNEFGSAPYLVDVRMGKESFLQVQYATGTAGTNQASILVSGPLEKRTMLTWEAHSCFIATDDSSTYQVENPSLADAGKAPPKVASSAAGVDAKKKETKAASSVPIPQNYNWRADEAKISKADSQSQQKQFYHFDRNKGVLTKTGIDGVTTVTHYLLTPGPMLMKIRKVEQIKNGMALVLLRNSYDELGRKIRSIDEGGNVLLWEFNQDGMRKVINGQLVEELKYKQGKLISKKEFLPIGLQETKLTHNPNGSVEECLVNGITSWTKTYRKDGTIASFEKADGTKILWRAVGPDGAQDVFRITQDGKISFSHKFFNKND